MGEAPRRAPRRVAVALLATAVAATLLVATPGRTQEARDAVERRPWYQVEVVLFLDLDGDRATTERLVVDEEPRWPADMHALAPPWPEPVRPVSVAELYMLTEHPAYAARLLRVTPGLTPEIDARIDDLRRLIASALRGAGAELPDLDAIAAIDWTVPEQALDAAPDSLAGAGPEPAAGDGPVPEAVPVPPIDPVLELRVSGVPDAGALGVRIAEPEPAPEETAPAPEDVPIPLDVAFRTVADDERVLAARYSRLARSAGYRPLVHLAWRQPFVEGAPALPVTVSLEDPVTGEARLVGTVGVALRRFLHLEVDLAWKETRADGSSGWIHIEQGRRMRSGEMHYVDHPRIGALVRVDPFLLSVPTEGDAPLVVEPIED